MFGLPVLAPTMLLLIGSNVSMTLAWYAYPRNLNDRPWWTAALLRWGVALAQSLLQMPANRTGRTQHSVAQLKILQEAITLAVFVAFAVFYMHAAPGLDYLWAGLCLLGAVCFIFRAPT